MHRLRQNAQRLKAETYALYLAYRHPLTPWYAKVFTGLVIAYAFSPIDLIPDFIPILGYLDDLVLVPVGIALAVKMIPAAVMDTCRVQAQKDLAGEKPVNWFVGALIVAVWIGAAAAVAVGLVRLFN
jgi:uncharacterized membrane protein YkvA (DUF1232 family)